MTPIERARHELVIPKELPLEWNEEEGIVETDQDELELVLSDLNEDRCGEHGEVLISEQQWDEQQDLSEELRKHDELTLYVSYEAAVASQGYRNFIRLGSFWILDFPPFPELTDAGKAAMPKHSGRSDLRSHYCERRAKRYERTADILALYPSGGDQLTREAWRRAYRAVTGDTWVPIDGESEEHFRAAAQEWRDSAERARKDEAAMMEGVAA